MALGFGYNAYVSWGEEITYGTPVAGSKSIEIESENIVGSRPPIPLKTLGFLSQRRTMKGKTVVSGGFKAPMQYGGYEQWLKHAFGASSVSTSGTNPYTHTYSLKAALPTGLTVLVNRDAGNIGLGSMFQYDGCHVSKLRLTQEIEQPLMLECELIGSGFTNVNIQAPSYPATFNSIDYGHLRLAQSDLDVDFVLSKFALEIDNKIEPKHSLLTHESVGPRRVDHRVVSFDAEIEFQDLDSYTQFRDGTTAAYSFVWQKTVGVATVDYLDISIPKSFLTEGSPETGGPGPYVFTLKGQALMSSADNDELALVLKNTTAGPI